MRRLAATGFVLVAIAQVMFLIMGGDRPAPYREVQAVSILATLAIVAGLGTQRAPLIVGGLAANALMRLLQPILGLTRLPITLNLLLLVGWILAAERVFRGRDPRAGLWILAIAHAISMLFAIGRLGAAVALALAGIGLFLAAPNMGRHEGPIASRDAREDRNG